MLSTQDGKYLLFNNKTKSKQMFAFYFMELKILLAVGIKDIIRTLFVVTDIPDLSVQTETKK